jgi:hypothetical protein
VELEAYGPSSVWEVVSGRLGAQVLRLEGRGDWWMVDDVDPVADSLVAFWTSH